MTRMLTIVLAMTLALAAPAAAQEEADPTPTPSPELVAPDEIPGPQETPPPGCERGEGTDADYAYCPDDVCEEDSDDADYTYGCEEAAGGAPGSAPAAPPAPRPASAVRPLAAQTLPVTGGEPAIIGAVGIAFLLAGAGLRLRVRV